MYADDLAAYNNPDKSIYILEQSYTLHSNAIALPILMLDISCRYNLQPKHTVNEIISASANGQFYGILTQAMNRLLESALLNNCPLLSLDDLEKLFNNLQNTKNLRGPVKGELLLMHSDIYVRQRRLSPAIETLDKAFNYLKSGTIPLRQAELLLSAGLPEEAKKYLTKAESINSQQGAFSQTLDNEIAAMKKKLE